MSKGKKQTTSAKLFLQREYMNIIKKPPSKYFKVEGLVDDNIQKVRPLMRTRKLSIPDAKLLKRISQMCDDTVL